MQIHYRYYTATDFLKDDKFLKWRLFPEEGDELFWSEFLKQYPEKRETLNEAIGLMSSVRFNEYAWPYSEKEAMWKNIDLRIAASKRSQMKMWRFVASMAACILLFLAGGYFLLSPVEHREMQAFDIDSLLDGNNIMLLSSTGEVFPVNQSADIQYVPDGRFFIKSGSRVLFSEEFSKGESHKLVVPRGKKAVLQLADNSKVWINSGTVIDYPSSFNSSKREISVDGEAYVEVTKRAGQPFVVNTSFFDIQVLGTKFNVSAYKDDSSHSVVLAQGSVKVHSEESHGTVQLKPDEMFFIRKGVAHTEQVNAYDYICWKDGLFYLESQSLCQISKRLSRYYDVNIALDDNIRDLKCSGKMILFKDLESTLQTVANTVPIKFHREGNQILITKKN